MYQWRRGATVLTGGGSYSGVDTSSLTVFPVGSPDVIGGFNCVVSNSCGSITSSSATLTICAADFNCDSNVDTDDLTDFIACYFDEARTPGICPRANFNGNTDPDTGAPIIDTDDLTDFIAAYFGTITGGC